MMLGRSTSRPRPAVRSRCRGSALDGRVDPATRFVHHCPRPLLGARAALLTATNAVRVPPGHGG